MRGKAISPADGLRRFGSDLIPTAKADAANRHVDSIDIGTLGKIRAAADLALTWGRFGHIQVNLTECLLSDIAENQLVLPIRLSSRERVLDKETGVHKDAHLQQLHETVGVAFDEMVFVDDGVNHLDRVAGLGVRCALAAWGYNGGREVDWAAQGDDSSSRVGSKFAGELGGRAASDMGLERVALAPSSPMQRSRVEPDSERLAGESFGFAFSGGTCSVPPGWLRVRR
jgi:hypothetical protein